VGPENKYLSAELDYSRYLTKFFTTLEIKYLSAEVDYSRYLTNFFTTLEIKYRVIKEINRYLAIDFNVFFLFSIDENKISDIIAFLLDPTASHGQGYLFLKQFLEVLKEENEILHKKLGNFEIWNTHPEVYVIREKITYTKRSIDIFVKLPGFVIGIENKPWAKEQDNQLTDYYEYLETKEKDHLLIYLDGYGRESKTIGEKKESLKKEGKFLELSYNNFLKPWLERCYSECKAEKVKMFLKDFINWLEVEFK
jgi:hypothetical protein